VAELLLVGSIRTMLTVGVFASIFDRSGRILLVRHSYGPRLWSTPGGRAVLRKDTEEILCEIRISHLIGVYAKPYRDDVVLSFHATIVSGIPRPCSPESSDAVFLSKAFAAV
jgi:8-oxo-dGTP diphosphatase